MTMRKLSWSKRAELVSAEIISVVDARFGEGSIYRARVGGMGAGSRQLLVGYDVHPQRHRAVTRLLTKLYGEPTVDYPGQAFANNHFTTPHGIEISFSITVPPNDYMHFRDMKND